MAIECPKCGEIFQDGRGLHGHLRFKEGLSGDELETVFEKAKGNEVPDPVEAVGPSGEFRDPVLRSAETLRRWKGRKEAIEESTYGYGKPLVSEGQRVKREAWDRCKEKVREAREALDDAIKREAERREQKKSSNEDKSLFS